MHDVTQFGNIISGNERRVFEGKVNDSKNIFNLINIERVDAIISLRNNFKTLSKGFSLWEKQSRKSNNLDKRNRSVSMSIGKNES